MLWMYEWVDKRRKTGEREGKSEGEGYELENWHVSSGDTVAATRTGQARDYQEASSLLLTLSAPVRQWLCSSTQLSWLTHIFQGFDAYIYSYNYEKFMTFFFIG